MKMFCSNLVAIVLAITSATVHAQQKAEPAVAASGSGKTAAGAQAVHSAKGSVKRVDTRAGVVVLAHGPVKSMNWPSMTMGFKLADKALLDKLPEGKAVEFDFIQSGRDYVVTAVR